jgi:hypothetical protein
MGQVSRGAPGGVGLSGKAEVLRLLAMPGCIFCRREREAVDRYFAWYLIEQYAEPETMARVRQARGFCRRHTEELFARALSSVASAVYLDLTTAGAELIRSAERTVAAGSAPGSAADVLTPKSACPACDSRDRSHAYLQGAVRGSLADDAVRRAFGASSGACLGHILGLAPQLDWAQTRFLVGDLLQRLARVMTEPMPAPGEACATLALLRGDEPEPPHGEEAARRTDADSADVTTSPASGDPSLWSPAVERLRVALRSGNCPVCAEEARVGDEYASWLSGQLVGGVNPETDDMLWLCRDHAWAFARAADARAVAALVTRLCRHWTAALQALEASLSAPPPAGMLRRLWWAWTLDRAPGQRVSLARRLRRAWARAMRRPRGSLAALREPLLREHLCPLCRAQRMRSDRLCDLLVRALSDPDTARTYQRATGLCYHHLPQPLTFCRDTAVALALLTTQRVRLEVLAWELGEFARKRAWSQRWEPKGDEESAWRRAAVQYAGMLPLPRTGGER